MEHRSGIEREKREENKRERKVNKSASAKIYVIVAVWLVLID